VRRLRVSSMPASEDTFARVVSLAVHDLRTPLATVSGFARTLQRTELGDPHDRYVSIMVEACEQLAELLDDVGLAARIDAERWEPNVQDVDTLELARDAAGLLDGATADGTGAPVRVDRDATTRAVVNLARCTLRHGGLESVSVTASGPELAIAPVTAEAAPVLERQTLRDLGAAVGARVVHALGGSVAVDGERLVIRLPT
jgi:signal transduction histidine kinase